MANESELIHSLCKHCKSEIKADAKKCAKCNEFQGLFRSFLSVGNMTIALVIGLVSVLAIAGPVVVDMFSTKQDNIRISVLDISGDEGIVTLFAVNQGNRYGAIRGAVIRPSEQTLVQNGRGPVRLRVAGEMLIGASDGAEVKLTAIEGAVPDRAGALDPIGTYTLIVEVVRFSGEVERVEFDLVGRR